jgi:3'-phosphoadenosine 5'-phosphosulfate (PAPS) 3'-phosphatase
MYQGAVGRGAHVDGSRIPSEPRSSGSGVIVVSPRERRHGLLRGLEGRWRIEELGSTTLKVLRVAEGGADAYVSAGSKGVWDVCAAHAIAGETGTVLVQANGLPISYRTAGDRVHGLLALSASALHAAPDLLERLRQGFSLPRKEQD